MNEKRFTYFNASKNHYIGSFFCNEVPLTNKEVVDLLNAPHEENEQLKQSYAQLKHRHSLLHDVCLDAECNRDMYHKDVLSLEKENEQLKKEKEKWKSNCSSAISENSILWNEIAIMREQGAKPSSAFEEYCSKFKGDV